MNTDLKNMKTIQKHSWSAGLRPGAFTTRKAAPSRMPALRSVLHGFSAATSVALICALFYAASALVLNGAYITVNASFEHCVTPTNLSITWRIGTPNNANCDLGYGTPQSIDMISP